MSPNIFVLLIISLDLFYKLIQTFEKVVQDSGAILVLMIKYVGQSMIYFG